MIGVDAGFGQTEALDGATADKVLGDNFFGVASVDEAVPDGFRVDHHDGAVLALVQATGLIDADFALEAGGLDGILQDSLELLAVLAGAAGSGGGVVALIEADKDVAFEVGHGDWMQTAVDGTGRFPHDGLGSARIGAYGI